MNSITMPTYAIFGGSAFYPEGGFKDIYGFCETFQEALIIYEEALKVGSKHIESWMFSSDTGFGNDSCGNRVYEPCDWAHIVNLKSQKIVVKSKY